MSAHWLFKTDPETYAWKDLVQAAREVWDGVSNPLALRHLRSVKKGDRILIYHSGEERAVVGIARAVSHPYLDPSGKDPRLFVIDIAPEKELERPVPLSEIKADPKLGSWELVRLSRLSVMPATKEQWQEVLRFAKSGVPTPAGAGLP